MQNEIEKVKNDIVIVGENGVPVTTSLKVAESFGKRHKHVLEAISNLGCSEKFRGPNFRPTNYLDKQGKTKGMYEMTRDGFTFLAMGFTGKMAAEFKERYIERFNEMEKRLREKQAPAPTGINIDALIKIITTSQDYTLRVVDKMMAQQEKRFIEFVSKTLNVPEKSTECAPDNQEDKGPSDALEGVDLDTHQDHFGSITKKREKRKVKKQAQLAPTRAIYYTTRSQIDFIEKHFARMKCGRLPLPLVGKNLKHLSKKMKLPPNAIGELDEHIGAYHEDVVAKFKEYVEKGYTSLLTNNLGSYMKPVTLYKAV